MVEKPIPPVRGNGIEGLRRDIDEGRTGDKVPFRDPAAVPLGADDEAAGHPPTAEAVALARAEETRTTGNLHPNATEQSRNSFNAQRETPWPGIAIGLAVLMIAAIGFAVSFAG